MGITTYLFHKSNGLEKQKFNMFFLDMGENIHFHYRDLRIELSVGEFKELAELFSLYSQEVLKAVDEGYQDGVLANTNEADTLRTFWDKEKPLTFPVKYNEQKIAIEETRDGYHLHLRNYKILLYKDSFLNLVKAFAPILPLLKTDTLRRDPLQLLVENELEAALISRYETREKEELIVAVDKTYLHKAGQVLKAIGYVTATNEKAGRTTYQKGKSTVILQSPEYEHLQVSPVVGTNPILALPEFFSRYGHELNALEINELKFKILCLLKMAASGKIVPFRLQDVSINRETLRPSVDLFDRQEDISPQEELEKFNSFLIQNKLFFVKPGKIPFSEEQQDILDDAFFAFVTQKLAAPECVKKIYRLGSTTNKRSGRYKVPFIHFDWVKFNSDFDILIELDPDFEGAFPKEWDKKFYWDRAGCDYYHFGDIGNGMASEIARQFPEILFYDHLVEGYLFDPLKSNKAKKDKWFKEINAQCIYSRDRTAEWINTRYDIMAHDTERFNVASFNKVYHVFSQTGEYVLKVFDSKYLTSKNKKKVAYEIGLLDSLQDAQLEIALPVKDKEGHYISQRKKEQTVLYTLVPGKYVSSPSREENMAAGNLLARFHNAAKHYKTNYANSYNNKQLLFYWLDAWKDYQNKGGIVGTDISLDIASLKRRLKNLKAYPTHCHGDLSLINYLFDKGKCWLIDFQSVGYGPALIDLTNGMIEFAAQKNNFNLDNMTAFRQGYESERELSPAENELLTDMLIIQAAVRQAKLLRLHYGGYGYELKEERVLGLRKGLEILKSL